MFTKESDMLALVSRWMRNQGMRTKSEFVSPWGICDIAGLRFNAKRVAQRAALRQIKPLTSVTNALLLLQIPDVESGAYTTVEKLVRACDGTLPPDRVKDGISRLIADRFVVCGPRHGLQKVNGWMPLHERLIAVELKLSRVDDVVRQAVRNLGFADESYVAMPSEIARRLASTSDSRFAETGIGLLSVSRQNCRVLIPPRQSNLKDVATQLYCVEKFWKTRATGN